MYFEILRTGENQKYKLFMLTFNLDTLKWPGMGEKMRPIVFSRSIVNPLPEVYYS